MKKRIISLVLSIVLLFSMLPFNVFAEESEILSSIVSNVQEEEVVLEETEGSPSQNEINESDISVIEEDTAGDHVQEDKVQTEDDTEPGEEEIPVQNNEDPVAVDDSKEEPQIVSAESILFEDKDVELFVGDSYLIKYSVLPDDTSDKSVKWTSSNEAIATVDNGVIKALSKGTTVITAYSQDRTVSSSLNIRVKSMSKSGGIEWEIIDGVLYITGEGPMDDYVSASDTPWYENRGDVTTVIISTGITHIGNYAFSDCFSLTKITIPDSVTSIGIEAFRDCAGLRLVYIPSSVTSISVKHDPNLWFYYGPFWGCSSELVVYCENKKPDGWATGWSVYGLNGMGADDYLLTYYGVSRNEFEYWQNLDKTTESIVIPDYISFIPAYAFADCINISNITIPDSVTRIGIEAFRNCTGLQGLFIPTSVINISIINISIDFNECYGPFRGCTSDLIIYCEHGSKPSGWDWHWNVYYNTWDDDSRSLQTVFGVGRNEAEYWITLDKTQESIVIPDYISLIPAYAFKGCNNIKSILLSESVTTINVDAFRYCTNLRSIYITGSVSTISVKFDPEMGFNYGPFWGCNPELVIYCQNNQIPDGWSHGWNFYGFNETDHLDSLKVCYGVEQREFEYWQYLDKSQDTIVIPDYITFIPAYAFSGCSEINNITIPESVTSIGKGAFKYCQGLRGIFIPSSISIISSCISEYPMVLDGPFWGCSPDLNVMCETSEQCDGWDAGWNRYDTTEYLRVTFGVNKYEADYWFTLDKEQEHIIIPEYVSFIPAMAFYGNTELRRIVIPQSVTRIGERAFYYMNIRDVYYTGTEANKDNIEIEAQNDYLSWANWHYGPIDPLESIHFLEQKYNLTFFDEYSFLNLSDYIVAVPGNAFYTRLIWTSSDESIATVDNTGKVSPVSTGSVTITAMVEDGGMTASCEVIIKEPVVLVETVVCGETAYADFYSDGTLYIRGTGVCEDIYNYSDILNKDDIIKVVIQWGIESIDDRAFMGFANLEVVKIYSGVFDPISIGSYAFANCGQLKHVSMGDKGVIEIKDHAFSGCNSLVTISISSTIDCIEEGVFEGCELLESIYLEKSIRNIKANAFAGCDMLQVVHYIGKKADADQMDILTGNEALINAEWIYQEVDIDYTFTVNGKQIAEITSIDDEINIVMDIEIPEGTNSVYVRLYTVPYGNLYFDADGYETSIPVIGSDGSGEGGLEIWYDTEAYPDLGNVGHIQINTTYIFREYEEYEYQEFISKFKAGEKITIYADVFYNYWSEYDLEYDLWSNYRYEYKSQTQSITVSYKIPVNSINLNIDELTLIKGEQEQLTATVLPENATHNEVVWTSSDETVATVDDTGKITAIGSGTAVITAATENGEMTATCTVSVIVPVQSIKLNKTSVTLEKGTEDILVATLLPEDATDKRITWSSSNESIVIIGNNGKIFAFNPGTAVITVTTEDGRYTAECEVTVRVSVSSVSLNKNELSMTKGSNETLTATVLPEDATDKGIIWTSSDESVVTVDTTGKVTAVGAGQATVTATTADGGKTAECLVTVTISAESVELNKTSLVIEKGSEDILIATVLPEDSTNKAVRWTSSDESIIIVSNTGKIYALKTGSAVITATTEDGGYTAQCEITVVISVNSVSINKETLTLVKGEDETLTATVSPEDATNKGVTWTSSDDSIVLVTGTGKIYALKAGTAVITATTADGGHTASCEVTVTVPVVSVSLNKDNVTLLKGAEETLNATVLPEGATDKGVVWTSSDDTVASVDEFGKVTAIGAGTAVITVTTEDGGKKAECTVRVNVQAGSVSLNKTEIILEKGDDETLIAEVLPEDATNKGVIWTSSDDSIALVVNGRIYALKPGTAVITVTTEDGGFTAECEVTVVVSSGSVHLNKEEITIEKGGYETLIATILPEDSSNKNVIWTSSDESIATVDETGKVTALSAGTAVITVTTEEGNRTAQCTVNVIVHVESISLEKAAIDLEKGQEEILNVTLQPSDSTNRRVLWTTSNAGIATVDENGKVTATGAGTAVITVSAEDGGKTAQCTVTVTVRAESVSLNNTEMTLDKGAEETLVAAVLPEDTVNKGVIWTSSDENIAMVDTSGKVTAKSHGMAVITVTTEDGGKTARCMVTVVVHPESIILNKSHLTLEKGQEEILEATVQPSDSTNNKVLWTTSNANIATVDEYGKITATGTGTAVITATTEDGGYAAGCEVTVRVSVSSVSLNKNELSLTKGSSETLTATVLPEDSSNKNIIWTSSNENIATVDDSGKVTAIGSGTAVITVTTEDGGKTAECLVTVEVRASGVEIDKTELTLEKGTEGILTATVYPEDSSNRKVSWTSSDESIVIVGNNGKVYAFNAGTAIITVTTEDGGFKVECEVTVRVSVSSVSLNKESVSLITGASETLVVSVLPQDATNNKVTWTSSDETVATVDDSGKVTAVGTGTAIITVTTEDGGKTAECRITVSMSATGVELDKTSLTLEKGSEDQLTATVLPEGTSNRNVTWSTSNESIVLVGSTGKVYALKPGTAVITVTTEDGGFTAECEVTVIVSADSVVLDKTEITIEKGNSETVTATVLPDDSTNKKVIWSSSDENVATVDENGKILATGTGTAVITVTTADGGKTAQCTVNVLPASVSSIELKKLPDKKVYVKDTDELDVTGGVIGVTYRDGTNEELLVAREMITGFDNTVSGEQVITVTFGGKTATYEITVLSAQVEIKDLEYTGTGVKITWTDIEEAEGYRLYREIGLDTWTLINESDQKEYLDEKSIVPGETYSYKVECYVGGDTGEASLTKSIVINPFKDVKTSSSYFKHLMWAYNNGVISGTSTTTFSPNADCTRGQLAVMLYRMYGKPSTSGMSIPFTDVKTSDYFYKAVVWAYNKGYIKGTSTTTFKPNGSITRQDMVVILWRINGSKVVDIENPFTDVKEGHYAYKAIMWAYKNKITSGTSATTFAPTANCQRYQLAVFLHKFNDIEHVIS